MSDRLVSVKTVIQVVGILVISTAVGLGYNSARDEGKVDLDRQYFQKQLREQEALKNGSVVKKDPVKPPVNDSTSQGATTTQSATGAIKAPVTPTQPPTQPETSTQPEAGTPVASGTETPEVVAPPPPVEVPEVPQVFPDGLQRMSVLDCNDLVGSDIAVFVDARKKADYIEGHLPGAVHLSHYESTTQIEAVRPILENAFMIIVYCNGGDCEDSINLALDLTTTYGFSNDSVYVFEGGMEEWRQNGFAVVKGENRD